MYKIIIIVGIFCENENKKPLVTLESSKIAVHE